MNCAASQAAIWHGLRGVNSTITCGNLSFLSALRYATNVLRRGYADAMIVGAAEEFTPHSAWLTHLLEKQDHSRTRPGEGAAAVVLERAENARRANRRPRAELLSVVTGFGPDGTSDEALTRCARRALARAELTPGELSFIATDDHGHDDIPATRISVKKVVGDCRAAVGGLQMVALLALHESSWEQDGRYSMILGRSHGGGVGAAVIRGWTRAGTGGGQHR
jgi:3-oxoacyl-[acyl-carrier-protein] synthase II